MTAYVVRSVEGKMTLIRKDEAPPLAVPARSDLPMPYFITDSMPAAEHPCDGAVYTSKSAFRRVTRANGCIEVGDQTPPPTQPAAPDRRAIKQSLLKAAARA